MTGAQQDRLRHAVTGANSDLVETARSEWHDGSRLLEKVALALAGAAPDIHDQIGETGRAAATAFTNVAVKVRKRATEMQEASDALAAAHRVLAHAEKLQAEFAQDPLQAPREPRTSPGASTPEDVRARQTYDTEKAGYDSAVADREARARAAADRMDAVYADSTATMKKVHGEPDAPPPPPPPGPDRTAGTPPGGRAPGGGHTPGPGGHPTWQPTDPSTGDGGDGGKGDGAANGDENGNGSGDGSGDGTGNGTGDGTPGQQAQPPGSAQGSTTLPTTPGGPGGGSQGSGTSPGGTPAGVSGPTAGGLGGALGGGAAGGLAGISGAVRGPLAVPTGGPGSASAPGGRIGSSPRAGLTGGALGRGTGAGGSTGAAGGAGGRGGSAGATRGTAGSRGAGGRGAAGSRGGAGGRGAGGSGSGRNKKDPAKKDTDFLEEEQDWVDDEGAAPGVID